MIYIVTHAVTFVIAKSKEIKMSYAIIDLSTAKVVDVVENYNHSKASTTASSKNDPKTNRPVSKAKSIFAKLADKPRREVILACVKAGINPNTASAQYYKHTHSIVH